MPMHVVIQEKRKEQGLICFQEDLSRREIEQFSRELATVAQAKGIAAGFETAEQKIFYVSLTIPSPLPYNKYYKSSRKRRAMKKTPQISRTEYEIMKIIWNEYPLSTNDITERAQRSHSWNQKTVHTLLSRLAAKDAVSYEKQGRMYYYSPLISKESYLQQENHTFLDRFYDGEIAPMLSSLLAHAELSGKDLKDLHEIINSQTRSGD